jgi:hypothetical protein
MVISVHIEHHERSERMNEVLQLSAIGLMVVVDCRDEVQ